MGAGYNIENIVTSGLITSIGPFSGSRIKVHGSNSSQGSILKIRQRKMKCVSFNVLDFTFEILIGVFTYTVK